MLVIIIHKIRYGGHCMFTAVYTYNIYKCRQWSQRVSILSSISKHLMLVLYICTVLFLIICFMCVFCDLVLLAAHFICVRPKYPLISAVTSIFSVIGKFICAVFLPGYLPTTVAHSRIKPIFFMFCYV